VAFTPDHPPDAVQEPASVDDHVSVEEPPAAMLAGDAEKDTVGTDGGVGVGVGVGMGVGGDPARGCPPPPLLSLPPPHPASMRAGQASKQLLRVVLS
jgi:hypothetical protein